jgi:hypothetical protein
MAGLVPAISGDLPEMPGTKPAIMGRMIARASIAPNPRSFGMQDE